MGRPDRDFQPIAVAFPIAEAQRTLMRSLAESPLPEIRREGAEDRPCTSCGMTLNCGPKILEAQVPIYCIICAKWLMLQLEITPEITSLSGQSDPEHETRAIARERIVSALEAVLVTSPPSERAVARAIVQFVRDRLKI